MGKTNYIKELVSEFPIVRAILSIIPKVNSRIAETIREDISVKRDPDISVDGGEEPFPQLRFRLEFDNRNADTLEVSGANLHFGFQHGRDDLGTVVWDKEQSPEQPDYITGGIIGEHREGHIDVYVSPPPYFYTLQREK